MSRSGLPSFYEWLAGLQEWVRTIIIEEMDWSETDQELLEEALRTERETP
jgi:hypothetical protein